MIFCFIKYDEIRCGDDETQWLCEKVNGIAIALYFGARFSGNSMFYLSNVTLNCSVFIYTLN